MKLRSGIISFVMVIVSSCAASTQELQRLTSSKTDCSENAIKISNSQVGMKTGSGNADCEGKTYYCAGDDMLRGVSCSEKKGFIPPGHILSQRYDGDIHLKALHQCD